MTYTDKTRVIRSLYKYFKTHPSTATQEDAVAYIYGRHSVTLTTRNFFRYLDAIRTLYCVTITYSNKSKSYRTTGGSSE